MKFSSNVIVLVACSRRLNPSPLACLPAYLSQNAKLTIPLSSTLNALKDLVNSALGPIERNQQRIFYLGRELKSGNRSLTALGVGNHGVYTVHLLSLAPRVVNLSQSHDAKDTAKSGVDGGRERRKGDVAESASRPTVGGDGTRPVGRQRQRVRETVVELLDSDNDDDDDLVEVIETTSKRRKRA